MDWAEGDLSVENRLAKIAGVALLTICAIALLSNDLAGMVWRLANAAMLAVGVVAETVAADIATDDRYSSALGPAPSAALLRGMLDLHATAMAFGLMMFGLGAGLHAALLWKSRYIPRLLSAGYLAVACVVFVSCFLLIGYPEMNTVVDPWVVAPDFFVELAVALWLIFRGVRVQAAGFGDASRG